MPRWKRAVYWWADLWPSDCCACVYVRFMLVGALVALIVIALVLYVHAVWSLN